jgi:GR25 family glycosyltransferase involved in LPS biosynthesis
MNLMGFKLADIGYYINLDESTDRREHVGKLIEQFEIENLERFVAKRNSLHHSSATKSHFGVFELCKQNNIDSVLVLEDDFNIFGDVHVNHMNISKPLKEYLFDFVDNMNSVEWDIILLGFNGKRTCVPVSKHLSINYKSTGAWGYIIKKNAYEYILENFNYDRDRLAIDDILPIMNFRGFKSLVSNVQIIHHGVGFVSTLNPMGPVNYTTWIEGNYYNSLYKFIKTYESFDDSLSQLYNNSLIVRDFVYFIKNFNGSFEDLMRWVNSKNLTNQIIFVENNFEGESFRRMNYNFSSECNLLIFWSFDMDKIYKVNKNIIEIEYKTENI